MHCEDVRRYLPEYALELLDAETRGAIEAHLAACPTCEVEVRGYLEAAASLAELVPQVEPRPQLKAELMAQLPRQGRVDVFSKPRFAPRFSLAGVVTMLALVSAVLLALSGVLWWRLQRLEQAYGEMPFRVVRLQGTDLVPQAEGFLMYEPEGSYAVLIVKNLPPTANQVYQLWLIRPDGRRVSGAVFSVPSDASWQVAVVEASEPLEHFPAFGVTMEPPGGSPQPTGPRVLGGVSR